MSYVHKVTRSGFHDFISSRIDDYILDFMDFVLYSSGKNRTDFPEGSYNIYNNDNRKKFLSVVLRCINC